MRTSAERNAELDQKLAEEFARFRIGGVDTQHLDGTTITPVEAVEAYRNGVRATDGIRFRETILPTQFEALGELLKARFRTHRDNIHEAYTYPSMAVVRIAALWGERHGVES